MIDNMEISNSPYLKLMGEPKLNLDTHLAEKSDLLEYQAFISITVVDIVIEQHKILSQQSSTDIISNDNHPSMDKTPTSIPSTYTHYTLITSSSKDIPSTSQSTLSEKFLSSLGTTVDEQIVITTLLGLSEGEKSMSERLGCSLVKGDLESEMPLISSKMACETERKRVPA